MNAKKYKTEVRKNQTAPATQIKKKRIDMRVLNLISSTIWLLFFFNLPMKWGMIVGSLLMRSTSSLQAEDAFVCALRFGFGAAGYS